MVIMTATAASTLVVSHSYRLMCFFFSYVMTFYMMYVDDKEKKKNTKKKIMTYNTKRKGGIMITLQLVVEKRLCDPEIHIHFFV
jgi:hypothetical protein